jgi:hypothetical protein
MATDPIGPPAARLRQNAAALTRTLHGNIRMLQRCQAEPAGVAPAGAGVAPVGAGVPPAGAGIVAPEAPQQQQHPVPGEQDAGRAGPGEPAAREWPRAYDRSDAPSCGEGPLSPGGLISSAEVLEFDRTIARPAAAPAAPLEPAAPSEPAAPVAAAASGHAPAGGDAGDAAAPGGPGVVCTLALGRRDRRPQAAAPALTQHDLAALAARDPAGPTDDELGILGHTQAPPGQTCDDSWRHPVRGPRAPRPETMTLEQRRAFYGYVVPPEFAAAGAVPPPPPACGPDGGGHEPGQ